VENDRDLLALIRRIVAGDADDVRAQLADHPALATVVSTAGAIRTASSPFFFTRIRHYLYAGDTALHMAAAAFEPSIAELLVANGAIVHAKNRFGAAPLHYAADTNHWSPRAQSATVEYLLSVGADPNAADRLRVTPLHRAVRTRSSPAVKTLLAGGADPRLKNGSGSTPLHLAVQTTGRGGTGSAHARAEQGEIIRLLLAAGAKASDRDGRGRSVRQAATGDATRHLIAASHSI